MEQKTRHLEIQETRNSISFILITNCHWWRKSAKQIEKIRKSFKIKKMIVNKRRLLIAGFIPFMCVFSITLIQTNIIFALDGMINHTAIDWARPKLREHFHSIDHINTCIQVYYFLFYFFKMLIFHKIIFNVTFFIY